MMKRWQFHTLNALGLLVAVAVLTGFWLGRDVQALNLRAARTQVLMNQSRQQVQPILQQVASAIARASDTDPALRDLLKKHGLNVTLNVDGKPRQYP